MIQLQHFSGESMTLTQILQILFNPAGLAVLGGVVFLVWSAVLWFRRR